MDRHVPGPVEHNRVVTGYGQLARLTLQRAAQHWRELDEHIARCTERIAQHRRGKANVRRASELIGIGPITASAAVARRQLQTV